MRPPASLVLPLALLLASSVPARAGDEAAEAAARLQEQWTAGVDAKTPEEVDSHRAALLEPVTASGSAAGLEAILTLAQERAGQVARWKERIKELDERDKEKADAEKRGDKTKPTLDKGVAAAAYEEEKKAKEDREKIPARLVREERWLPRLAEAAGKLLDAIPDADYAKSGAARLRGALDGRADGWEEWMVAAAGLSTKERTAKTLLEAAADALVEYRKSLTALVKPSARLTEVTKEYAERERKFLDQNPGATGIPSGLVLNLKKELDELQSVVGGLTGKVQGANTTRRTSRAILGRILAGAAEDVRDRILGVLEKEVLGEADFETRSFGLAALGPCPGDRAMRFLREAAKDPSPEVVVAALDALSIRSEAEALEILVAALGDGRWQVRATAAAGIATYGRAVGVPPLLAALAKAEARGIDDLRAALARLTGKSFPAVAAAWEEWWAKEGAGFRGPKDPGGATAAKAGEAGAAGAPTDGGGNTISFYGIESRSDKVLFVLDFSGSMNFPGSEAVKSRKKIDILYEQFRKTMAGLPDGTKFNIVAFSFDVRLWKKTPSTRDAKVAKEAVDWVEKQRVDGGTNIYDALDTAFKLLGVGATGDKNYQPNYDTLFFMTDGVPTAGRIRDKKAILGEVRRWNEGRRIKLHVIGMGGKEKDKGGHGGGSPSGQRGDDIDKDFLEKLAKQNEGDVVFR